MSNNSSLHSIKDIGKHTGLSSAYIDKCINKLSEFLSPHCKRGNKNSRLFTSNGLVIFDRIKQLKESGLSLPEIEKRLSQDMETGKNSQSELVETGIETGNSYSGDIVSIMQQHHAELKQEMEKRIRLQAEKDEVIMSLQREKEALSGAVKLLTAGKTPEETKQAWEAEQIRLIRIQEVFKELKSLNVTQWLRHRTLMKELDKLLAQR